MQQDPIFGPIPPDEFRTFASLPYGEARKAIQKRDPLWGIETGQPIEWKVKFTRKVYEEGYATVRAATQEEAQKIAEKMPEYQISWSADDCDETEIESVEPKTS